MSTPGTHRDAPRDDRYRDRPGGRRRSLLLRTALGLAVVATLLASAWWGADRVARDPLDPNGADPKGSRALARVLAESGTDVQVVRTLAGLESARPADSTTVVVTSSTLLGNRSLDRLLTLAAEHRVVVADASPGLHEQLGVSATGVAAPPPLAAACAPGTAPLLPDLAGLELDVPRAVVHDLPGCFPEEGGTVLSVVGSGAAGTDAPLVLFGAGSAWENSSITDGDNAAVALRLLGQDDHLLWYVPDPNDLVQEDDPPAGELLPDWLFPALWLVALAGVALALWRGRRLGPLSVEPLPVTVRAIESTLGRGRLHQRSRDRRHTATTLRDATARRLLHPGGAGPTPGSEAVPVLVAEVARRTGRPPDEVAALLDPASPAPTDDDSLVRLAQALTALEEEVRRS